MSREPVQGDQLTESLAGALLVETRPGIKVENLVKTYRGGKKKALNGLSLLVEPGEAVGLIGPNGAGKTTFLSCLMGFLHFDSGTIEIDGEPPCSLTARRSVGYLPERLTFDRWMTGRDYMHYHHQLSGMPESSRKYDCEELLKRVELESLAWAQPVKKYSRGMLQRLGLAQALLGKPRYLLLDEPASGMDPGGVLVVRNLLKELRKEGLTIVLNSHQLDQIEKVCDRVVMIEGGFAKSIDEVSEPTLAITTISMRWLNHKEPHFGVEHFGAIAQKFALEIKEIENGLALLSFTNEAQVAALVKALVEKDFQIVSLAQVDNRLEKLFLKDKNAV